MSSPILGQTETYVLPKAPLAMSMGQIVEAGRPMIWLTGQLPFHVSDMSKLQVICPLKYRMYADRIEENVPMFKETVQFSNALLRAANVELGR